MKWTSPFDRCSNPTRNRALIIFFFFSAILLVAMRILDIPLRTPAAPMGIVSFELAKNLTASHHIMDSWTAWARTHAALSLGLDYLFLIVYAMFISLACVQVGRTLQDRSPLLAATGVVLAWAQFLAAILDAVENLALIALLLESDRWWLPAVARGCAIIKFSIVSAGLMYIGSGLFVIGAGRIFKGKNPPWR